MEFLSTTVKYATELHISFIFALQQRGLKITEVYISGPPTLETLWTVPGFQYQKHTIWLITFQTLQTGICM